MAVILLLYKRLNLSLLLGRTDEINAPERIGVDANFREVTIAVVKSIYHKQKSGLLVSISSLMPRLTVEHQ